MRALARDEKAELATILDVFPPTDQSHRCATENPEAFFLPDAVRGSTRRGLVAAAQRICAGCSYVPECIRYARALHITHGIWGGIDFEHPDAPTSPATSEEIHMPPAPTTPTYIVEITDLLIATEGHADPSVRAVRKILTQTAVALRAMVQTSSPGENPTPATTPPEQSPSAAAPSGPEPFKKSSRADSEAVRLMRNNGVTASQVRLWARHVGHEVGDRGGLPADLVQAYLDAVPAHEDPPSITHQEGKPA